MNKFRTWTILTIVTLLLVVAIAQPQDQSASSSARKVSPSAAPSSVTGSGNQGQIAKWVGVGGNTFVIGNSGINEDKFGNVGIGTNNPTAKLEVFGHLDSSIEGPAGVVRIENSGTAAALFAVSGPSLPGRASAGVFGQGGDSDISFAAGGGVVGLGGVNTNNGIAGSGVVGFGGRNTNNGNGGDGVTAIGGNSKNGSGGTALRAVGGIGLNLIRGFAGEFEGDVDITGNLSKGGGSFKIDHPLDPANKYLYHSFVESPDMMNIYNGNVRLDSRGEAVIELPEWFEALNRDFRYSLTAIGAPGPNLYVAEEVTDNHFKIAGGMPGAKVSWTLTGIRHDAWANAHRIPVEKEKSDNERGHYLHPELFNQPEEKGVNWAEHRALVRRVKQLRNE